MALVNAQAQAPKPGSWFTARKVAEGTGCIEDHGSDNMYVVEGKKKALRIDTGLGFAKLSDFVKTLTRLPVVVVNTHGHGDHAGGNYQFKSRDMKAVRAQKGDELAVAASEFSQATVGSGANNAISPSEADAGWVLLFDGHTLTGWQPSGQATWIAEEGEIRSKGQVSGYLRTVKTFENFELKAEFWADMTMNSAIFVRCPSDLKTNVSPRTCYEVNIFDPHELWPTGSVNDVHSVLPNRIDTAGRWNLYEITLDGSAIRVKLNGKTTVDARDGRFTSGTIALQANGPGSSGGVIRFRNIKIRPL